MRIKPSQDAGKELTLFSKHSAQMEQYTCDHIFKPADNNEDIFQQIEPLLNMSMQGTDTCVVAYGGSGSDKTHTMVGGENEEGIISRTVENFMRMANNEWKILGYSFRFLKFITRD